MLQLKNDRILRTIRREKVDKTPIWIMRQAGRYLPEYRAVREKAGSFMALCKTPELACEVTLQPLRRFDLDAAIIFSDILTIPDSMGLGLHFVEGEGPQFAKPIRSLQAVNELSVPDPLSLQYVYDAIHLVKHELAAKVPLIGFCGSPWTLATYMVEGRAKNGFPMLKKMLIEDPLLLHNLLNKLALSVSTHLNAQIKAGADIVMIFDTWGGMLSTLDYQTFSLAYVKEVIAGIKPNKPPVILFTKGGGQWLEFMAETGCDVVGIDWEISLQEARARIGKHVAIQGNLNPAQLLSSPEQISENVAMLLASYGKGSGHIFNLGHGITPDVSPEHVTILVDAVHELSAQYHQ